MLLLPDEFCSPGFWVIAACLGKKQKYTTENVQFGNQVQEGYSKAIAFDKHLSGVDSYEYERINEGLNYSTLVQLDCQEVTDQATSTINSCIRSCSEHEEGQGISDLCNVVGELHDNVWSHGLNTGFSMAQKFNGSLEFALVDSGLGFLREVTSIGLEVSDHQGAIEWCIQKGHSTKLRDAPENDWDQKVPTDQTGGNPYGNNVPTFHSDNHHQGLGLYKLIQLVRKYAGNLCICSGDCIYTIDSTGNISNEIISEPWQGVAISCRFPIGNLSKAEETKDSPEISDIVSLLRR
ncbi:MAG: hypothetical protein DIZ80_10460 [endosymbiont of Galathealinum brachiosum]|uniref:Uncharacterized protein n=1 Tax=endosymbiont of Galathealinum brachiosum TaxID=2200906 RepID=A0A370DCU0_9GAMM|nr:MAG: hypothetical protein DIZ80_10460 [endosymbiont of Galathealinum brachiosum]